MVVILKIRLSPLFAAGQIWWSGTMLSGFFSFNPQIIDIVGLMIIVFIFGALTVPLLIIEAKITQWPHLPRKQLGSFKISSHNPQCWSHMEYSRKFFAESRTLSWSSFCKTSATQEDDQRWSKMVKTHSDEMKNPLLSFVPCVNLCRSHYYCMYCLYCIFV